MKSSQKKKPGKKWYSSKGDLSVQLLSLLRKPNYAHWFLAILSGLITGLSLPNASDNSWNSLLAWFGLVPLFCVLWFSENLWQAAAKAFLAGLSFNLVGFRFLLGIHPLDWLGVPDDLSHLAAWTGLLVAATQQAFYWSIYGLLFKLLHKVLGISQWTSLQGAVCWVFLLEKFANTHRMGGNPWTSLYYSQHDNLYLIQLSEWLGGSAISFLLIFVNITLAYLLIMHRLKDSQSGFLVAETKKISTALSMGLQATGIFFIFLLYGIWVIGLSGASKQSLPTSKVLLLQKNLGTAQTRFAKVDSGENAEAYLKLFRKVQASGNPNLVVLPEGSIQQKQFLGLAKSIQSLNPASALISGSYFSNPEGESFNSALACSTAVALKQGYCKLSQVKHLVEQHYLKQALVPFGEFTPFESFFTGILNKYALENLAQSSFVASKEGHNFDLGYAKVSPLICFEIAFPGLVNKQVKRGSEGVILIGDASWFHDDRKLVAKQMLAISQFRAVESRRDIIVDVNGGVLAHIDRFGTVKNASSTSEFLFADLALNTEYSSFTRNQF